MKSHLPQGKMVLGYLIQFEFSTTNEKNSEE